MPDHISPLCLNTIVKNKENPFNLDFCSVFESCPGQYLILSADPNFTILGVSKSYAKATMIEKERVVGKTLFQVFPDNPNDPAADGTRNLRASLLRVLKEKVRDDMPVQKYDIQRPSGEFEVRWWTPSNTPVFDSKGKMIAIIHQAEDVTEFVELRLKGLEQEKITEELRNKTNQMEYEIFGRQQELLEAKNQLRAANEGLEEKVKERTKDLNKAIAARDEFLSIASHELKTPITSLKMQLQMTKRSLESQKGKLEAEKIDKALDFSTKQVDRLTVLVEELLDITRLDSGKFRVDYEEFDLSELIHHVVERMSVNLLEGPKEKINSSLKVTADRFRIEQVIVNLISNALKYGNDKPVKVSVFQEGKFAKIIVEDQGIGISPDKINIIFERFERAIGHENISGLGLGLYIAREIILAHHGRIEVTSKLGEGSCFTVYLPIKP